MLLEFRFLYFKNMKKLLLILFLLLTFLKPSPTLAAGNDCYHPSDCAADEICVPKSITPAVGTSPFLCVIVSPGPASAFGKIIPPPALDALGVGSLGVSKFFNNLISLIYIIAAIVFVFMIIFGALQWLTSGGDKDAVKAARDRIIHAIVGFAILAAAFAIIKLVGTFTGFTFFK